MIVRFICIAIAGALTGGYIGRIYHEFKYDLVLKYVSPFFALLGVALQTLLIIFWK